jgi:hypothetical protein
MAAIGSVIELRSKFGNPTRDQCGCRHAVKASMGFDKIWTESIRGQV